MRRWIIVIMVLLSAASAEVEQAATGCGAGGCQPAGTGPGPMLSASIPSYIPVPTAPGKLEVEVKLVGPSDSFERGDYYTSPGKIIDYSITVKNLGYKNQSVTLTVMPETCLAGWFSWTKTTVTIPARGAAAELLQVSPELNAMAGDYSFSVIATAPETESACDTTTFRVQNYDYASETLVSGTGQFQLSKDVRSMDSAVKSNKAVYFSGSVDALIKNEYLVDRARGRNPNFEEQDAVDNYVALSPTDALAGSESFRSSIAFGGIGARVQETYDLKAMEYKSQSFNLHQTGSLSRMAEFKTADNFSGYFSIDARQVKPGQRSMKEFEEFSGDFELQRRILFRDNPTFPSGNCFGGACDFMKRFNNFRKSV